MTEHPFVLLLITEDRLPVHTKKRKTTGRGLTIEPMGPILLALHIYDAGAVVDAR